MAKAIWEGVVIAESDQGTVIEGNYYFPPDSIRKEHFEPSTDTTTCPWKGVARYYDVVVDGKRNAGAAWYYPEPFKSMARIQNHVAFWRGVRVDD